MAFVSGVFGAGEATVFTVPISVEKLLQSPSDDITKITGIAFWKRKKML